MGGYLGIPGGIDPGPNLGGAVGIIELGAGPPSPLTGPASPTGKAPGPRPGARATPRPAALATPAPAALRTGACLLRISYSGEAKMQNVRRMQNWA